MESITAFVDELAAASVGPQVNNFYAGESLAAAVHRANLIQYLHVMRREQPALLLLGEAPGFRGCGRTGIPFTSEAIMISHQCLGTVNGFRLVSGSAPQREATATIVWRTLDELALRPLLWNVFPFHPHRSGQQASNRAPSPAEVQMGQSFFRALLVAFPITTVVAVGSIASRALEQWGIAAILVRHPSHGGAARFRQQLNAILATHDHRSVMAANHLSN